MRLVTAEELVRLPRPAIDWLIHRLIPRPGLILLLGPPKAGKSYLALQVAFSVARGGEFLGQKCEPTKVLYLQVDTSTALWTDRLVQLEEAGVDISGPVQFVHPDDDGRVNVLTDEGRARLREILRQSGAPFIIIDVLREIHTGDENKSHEMKTVGDYLIDLLVGRSVLLVHHTKKIPADVTDPDPVLYGRGSTYLTGKMDANWLLYRGKLRVQSRFDEDITWKAERTDTGTWAFPEAGARRDMRIILLKLCKEFPESTHAKIADVARDRLNISRATYYRLIAGHRCEHSKPQV